MDCPYRGVALSQGLYCTNKDSAIRVAFIEGCSHVRGGLYEGLLSVEPNKDNLGTYQGISDRGPLSEVIFYT